MSPITVSTTLITTTAAPTTTTAEATTSTTSTTSTTISVCTATETPSILVKNGDFNGPLPSTEHWSLLHKDNSWLSVGGISNDWTHSLNFGTRSFTDDYIYQEIRRQLSNSQYRWTEEQLALGYARVLFNFWSLVRPHQLPGAFALQVLATKTWRMRPQEDIKFYQYTYLPSCTIIPK
ncbi:hypothetical protein CEP52_000480 [Fusarium oligoseptatum]|uniref:Uncharacterized protein n=1 Tax=Fusarium oligoseptatum TaxID=2604345 RepID=A0A428UP51_9HYPO|nr:hypothetical protein CEP52_000480 [Fusarium oligoseptatum]